MLEGLVAWVLNNYLGKYVENLNTDQLSVALLSGKVELENLPLKKDALRHLGLPVEIKSGFIGKVQLQVPVRQIRSAPWLIAIEKLYLVAAPINLDEWESAVEAQIAHERKVALLDALEAQWRADYEASDGYYATSYSSWLSYGTGLLANIVENLQLKLNDVHIRYEDALTMAPSAFACGLTAASLTAESCDSSWRRGFTLLADCDGCSFKLLELQQLAVYWDPMTVPSGMYANCTLAELTERMCETWRSPHAYLVRPASAAARVRRERCDQPLRSRTRPRFTCRLTLDAVQLTLSSRQYNEAVGCVVGLERVSRLREFRALRPAAPVRSHARLWWLYALRCHYPDHRWMDPKPNWESCLEQARQTQQYVEICLSILSNPTATLPPDKKAAKDDYEWKMPLQLLKSLREVAMRKVPKATPVSTPDKPSSSGRSMLVHWFPQWWGWYGSPSDSGDSPPIPPSAPPDLEEEILDVIADSLDNNTLLKRDTVFGKFEFMLNKGCLNLCMDNVESEVNGNASISDCVTEENTAVGLELQFSQVCVAVESRPRSGSHALHVSLGSVLLRDHVTPNTLFPILIAPQGMIREGLSAMNATASVMWWCRTHAAPPLAGTPPDPLFQLTYEKKPFGLNCDYKLWVKSASLEVVWCPSAARWAAALVGGAMGGAGTSVPRPHRAYVHVRDRTRATIIDQWEHIVHPQLGERRSWQVELDISAPQILFAERLCERDAAVLVVDFGRLRLTNAHLHRSADSPPHNDDDDEERFMTPCSTPPGSLLSPASPPDPSPTDRNALDAANLHSKLYDRYKIEFSDLQILVGRARDNWKYAHTKSTSSLHLLDRFSISLQAERRVVATSDPQYPSATLCGTLPALVVHLSEHKLAALHNILANVNVMHFSSRDGQAPENEEDEEESSMSSETEHSELSSHNNATLFMLQFAIDQMSLEVQSRGRSIAEVQVCGVKAALTTRPADASLSLSVHSLLLVDALQTYGPDFELLVASHKHVGMDTASGSIRDSEPTSPTSPSSLDARAPPPHALQQALYSLHYASANKNAPDLERSSPAPSWTATNASYNTSSTAFGTAGSTWGPGWGTGGTGWGTNGTGCSTNGSGWGAGGSAWGTCGSGWGAAGMVDSEALIAVELCLVKGEGDTEDLRIANILFNNLDIIANQETIVELIGFIQRVMGPKSTSKRVPSDTQLSELATVVGPPTHTLDDEVKKEVRTEITFDFHRLGVLLVRAGVADGAPVARKVATATLGEARIQATVASRRIEVGGSLGGVQVVSLCEDAGVHTRVISAGRLPPHPHPHHPHPSLAADDHRALYFTITRRVDHDQQDDQPVVCATVSVQVASVWYTHSGALLHELHSCLAEFKQYLANLARSIRAAAADMAIGLVHPRGESLYANPKLSQSTEGVSPRRRTTSLGCSMDEPADLASDNIVLTVNIELESPVVVVPRSAQSSQVFVAHLGRMSLSNRPGAPRNTTYRIRIRDISLASVDVAEKLKEMPLSAENMSEVYNAADGKPVLHDTALQFAVHCCDAVDAQHQVEVSGAVVGGLQVSARREQYEQLLDTLRSLAAAAHSPHVPHAAGSNADVIDSSHQPHAQAQSEGVMLEPAVPTLRLDPQLRAAVLAVPPPHPARPSPTTISTPPSLKVEFELAQLTVELVADLGGGERSLVQLAFRELQLRLLRTLPHETTLQVSLHSITMEDLTQEPESKHRTLMVSHTPPVPPKAVFLSKSCPELVAAWPDDFPPLGALQRAKPSCISLPSELNVVDRDIKRMKRDSKCGITPPCSPEGPVEGVEVREDSGGTEELSAGDNLVLVSVHMRDPQHPLFEQKYNKVSRLTKVEFNCLKLVVSIDSWVAVLDFFGVAGEEPPPEPETEETASSVSPVEVGVTETEMSIRSLSVVLVSRRGEVCRALVSRVYAVARAEAAAHARSLIGRLGALQLADLTPHAPLWRDRFGTHGDHALTFEYQRLSNAEAAVAGHDTRLSIEMGPVTYVHTKRFVHELKAFARDFSQLRGVILQARRKVSVAAELSRAQRLRLRLRCVSPEIVVPASGRARAALVAQLARLHLDNRFALAGDPDTVSTRADNIAAHRETLDVRSAQLEGVSLWCGAGGRGLRVRRRGAPLLPAPACLALRIEHNMSDTHNVPDMTVQGTLTTLQCALDPQQYRLIRGVLAHNLGENVDDLLPTPHSSHSAHQPTPVPQPPAHSTSEQVSVWTTSSLKLDLHDVSVTLEPEHGASSLACINFIKSRLLVETYSDLSQDIDLVSQEILVSDTRYTSEPANRRGNVFSHIVQPLPEHRHSVQAEVHARKRGESCAYTILVNNMRLMAILDWWEAANQFIMQPPVPPADPDQAQLEEALCLSLGSSGPQSNVSDGGGRAAPGAGHMELKLNVTDSQLVLVEDASVWDTNAVILKSTTVITYRSTHEVKPVSCELNELEVFSCVLGLEEETALSILDPAALTVALHRDNTLHVSTGTLNLRLSYHDMRMFAAMIHSLPEQARAALSGKTSSPEEEKTSQVGRDAPANSLHMRASAGAAAGGAKLCPRRWLPLAPPPPPQPPPDNSMWPLKALQVNADCVTLCVIDDCLDSDVPLLEISLSELNVEQDLRKPEESYSDPVLVSTPGEVVGAAGTAGGAGGGRLAAVLTTDYYNRTLSGWEPVIEPWRFESRWEYTLSSALSRGRVQLDVRAVEVLNTNVTSALVDLVHLVRNNWTADYYAPQSVGSGGGAEASPKGSPAGHRRRSPFVPYALRNHTGHRLWFTTLLTTADVLRESSSWSGPDDSWVAVRAGETEPFSFGARRGRGRARTPPPDTLRQLQLRLDGWTPPDPVCVDRVGVFFRHLTHAKSGAEARIVFEVSLEGSARKLVTVRSALQLRNELPHAVDVRLDAPPPERGAGASVSATVRAWSGARQRARALAAVAAPTRPAPPPLHALHPIFDNCGQWSSGVRSAQVSPGESWAAPLSERAGALWTRPLVRREAPAPPLAPAPIDWRDKRAASGQHTLLHYECRAPPDYVYRFCCVIVRERFPPDRGGPIAGHTLTLVPALRLENLLPLELQYRAAPVDDTTAVRASAALPASDTKPFHEVNVEEGVELSVKLEGFGWSSALCVGGASAAGSFTARLTLRDIRSRRLYLNARVAVTNTDGIKVSISAPYWLVNRTGLPLVFRAEGGAAEAAGQFAEHELARMVAPLPFAFADTDAAPTLSARLGSALPGNPEWCSPFGLGPGVAMKRLEVRGGAGGERAYAVGVAVRAGRGRYRRTNIVTFAPRYQIHNNTSHHLQFAQKCTATTLNDPGAMATHVSAVAGCYLPWHWPRWDREQLLCVRVLTLAAPVQQPRTAWSGGFRIDTPRSLHIACRESGGGGGYVLVRVEVASQGAALLVVLTDGDSAPPPLRIDNYSPVAVMFHQVGCSEECVVGAHSRAVWALPEPEGAAELALRAPGGPRTALPLRALGATHILAYQNFIYVAFTATAVVKINQHRDTDMKAVGNQAEGAGVDNGVLVLEVPAGSTRVLLARKRYGDRSQLWRRAAGGQLVHEGSSPPQPGDALLADDAPLSPHAMVLDIEGPAPRPGQYSPLALRRADPRRASTQAWRLVGGRMACAHANLCVQPDGGLMSLTPGSRVVLGLPGAGRGGTGVTGGAGGSVPPEQAVAWHSLRPGSGRLDLTLTAHGPTRLLRIYDRKDPDSGWIEGGDEDEEAERRSTRREWGLHVSLQGLSVSVVSRSPPAELLHALLAGVLLELSAAPTGTRLALSVRDMQWDNQLLGTPSPVLLYCVPERGAGAGALPALHAALELMRAPTSRYNAYFFRHLIVALRPLAIRLEERLILRLWAWAAPDEEEAAEGPDEADYETRRALDELTALHATRYYFAVIKIIPSQIRLSMTTANKLEGELSALKRRLGLTLIRFEDAAVELEPFVREHPFDTAPHLARQMLKHFKDELKWQAAKILGSVDFLGNPLGFVADVSEGVSGLLYEGNVTALLQNVTHGISNSAAKVTESLSDGLERVVSDEAHEETRRRIRSAASGAHLAAGFRGLGLGILGGVTSLVKHSYEGATQEGLPGFLVGVGKGLVGTVTKPVIGVLDLAAETASALRDTSRRSDKWVPCRIREPRCAAGAGGLLPRYCAAQAAGAALLRALNGDDHSERFLAYRIVRDTPHDIRALLSNKYLRIFTCKNTTPQVVMETHLSNLVSCAAVSVEGAHFVELGVRGAGAEGVRRPRVQCDSAELAAWVARHAAHARRLHHEDTHTLHPHPRTDI